MEPIIKVEAISKKYRVGTEVTHDSLTEATLDLLKYPFRNWKSIYQMTRFSEKDQDSTMWALRDVSFNLFEGEVLGVIGKNGAGKSTLLKILSQITEPSSGEISIRGNISSLLEVGTGFHEELTGRDNVYFNGTILGMSKKEIDRKFDEIVAFSGVERYIDTPVKFYSSGMKVRLAFSVAAHLEPDILIIDEVLAVGDLAFQQKCLNKMDEVKDSGRTILFVSHSMNSIEGLCSRCILLENGKVTYNGDTKSTIEKYQEINTSQSNFKLKDRTDRAGEGNLKFTEIILNEGSHILPNESLKIDLYYTAKVAIKDLAIAVKITKSYQQVLTTIDSKSQGVQISVSEGQGKIRIKVPSLRLLPGNYLIDLWAGSMGKAQDRIFAASKMRVGEKDFYGTGIGLNAEKHGYLITEKCDWKHVEE